MVYLHNFSYRRRHECAPLRNCSWSGSICLVLLDEINRLHKFTNTGFSIQCNGSQWDTLSRLSICGNNRLKFIILIKYYYYLRWYLSPILLSKESKPPFSNRLVFKEIRPFVTKCSQWDTMWHAHNSRRHYQIHLDTSAPFDVSPQICLPNLPRLLWEGFGCCPIFKNRSWWAFPAISSLFVSRCWHTMLILFTLLRFHFWISPIWCTYLLK